MPKNAFFWTLFSNFACGAKNFAKTGTKPCLGAPRKINSVDLKKKLKFFLKISPLEKILDPPLNQRFPLRYVLWYPFSANKPQNFSIYASFKGEHALKTQFFGQNFSKNPKKNDVLACFLKHLSPLPPREKPRSAPALTLSSITISVGALNSFFVCR